MSAMWPLSKCTSSPRTSLMRAFVSRTLPSSRLVIWYDQVSPGTNMGGAFRATAADRGAELEAAAVFTAGGGAGVGFGGGDRNMKALSSDVLSHGICVFF